MDFLQFDPQADFKLLLAVPLIPLVGYVVQIFFGRFLPRKGDWLLTAGMFASMCIAVLMVAKAINHGFSSSEPFFHLSNCVIMRTPSRQMRSVSGIRPRHSGQTSRRPCCRMLATQPRQKRWPHGIVCGCRSTSRQMAHSSPPASAPTPLCAEAAAARGFARAVLGLSALTHFVRCPAFQCFF